MARQANKAKRKKIATIRTVTGKSAKTGNDYKITNLVFEQGVKILVGRWDNDKKDYVDFKEVPMDKYRSAEVVEPGKLLQGLLEKGYIDEAEFEKRQQKIEEKNISREILLNLGE